MRACVYVMCYADREAALREHERNLEAEVLGILIQIHDRSLFYRRR
jgi:hypothetical protein